MPIHTKSTMGKNLNRLTAAALFLIALEILIYIFLLRRAFADPELGIFYILLSLMALAIPIIFGIFFLKTREIKSRLLKAVGYLISIPTFVNIILIALLFLLTSPDPHKGYIGQAILASLSTTISAAIASIGIILTLIHLIKRNKQ